MRVGTGNIPDPGVKDTLEFQKEQANKDIPTGLLRQRRNLMAMCVALLALKLSGGTISEIPILGSRITGIYHDKLIACLWLVCFYFLYRCYIYTRNERGYYLSLRPWRDRLYQYVEENIQALVQQKCDYRLALIETDKQGISHYDLTDQDGTMVGVRLGVKGHKIVSSKIPAFLYTVQLKNSAPNVHTESNQGMLIGPMSINILQLKGLVVPALIELLFKKRDFSDYLFPFVLFGVTILEYWLDIVTRFIDLLLKIM